MAKPSGTGIPSRISSARFAPLPPSDAASPPLASASHRTISTDPSEREAPRGVDRGAGAPPMNGDGHHRGLVQREHLRRLLARDEVAPGVSAALRLGEEVGDRLLEPD